MNFGRNADTQTDCGRDHCSVAADHDGLAFTRQCFSEAFAAQSLPSSPLLWIMRTLGQNQGSEQSIEKVCDPKAGAVPQWRTLIRKGDTVKMHLAPGVLIRFFGHPEGLAQRSPHVTLENDAQRERTGR